MRFSSALNVRLDKLGANLDKLKLLAPKTNILFMVKADAYGHGMGAMVQYAVNDLGIKEFGLATLGEAISLRKQIIDKQFDIYVFSDLDLNRHHEAYLEHRLIPVLSCKEDLNIILKNKKFKYLPIVLKFDTGMHRLGFNIQIDLPWIIDSLKKNGRSEIFHLMSHFANSSDLIQHGDLTYKQYENFRKIQDEFKNNKIEVKYTSISNSAAIEQKFSIKESHIRPGIMLYGPSSMNMEHRKNSHWSGENISQLYCEILKVDEVRSGFNIGYGARTINRDGFLILVSLGYGDGINSRYSGVQVEYQGFVGEIVGRINMDMTYLLFPMEAKNQFKKGERFIFWDHQQKSVLKISDQNKVIPYELFCSITSRVPRTYQVGK